MRRPALPRGALLSVTAALIAAFAAGCGGSTMPGTPGPQPALTRFTTLAQLAAATGAQMKADRTAKITVTGGTSGGQMQASTTGEGAISFDPAGPSMRITERVQQAGAPAATELSLVVLPDQAYVKPPADAGVPVPPGKSWLRIQPNAADPITQQFAQLVRSVRANADPTQSFTQFGDAAQIVQSAEDPLDGVPAVRYQIRVDITKAAALEGDPTLKLELEQTVQRGMAIVDSSLWLDARNRPLRVLLQQPMPAEQGTYTVDARYRDWGVPVEISPPPPAQVAPS